MTGVPGRRRYRDYRMPGAGRPARGRPTIAAGGRCDELDRRRTTALSLVLPARSGPGRGRSHPGTESEAQ